ncbi:MAG: hypothetical protein RL673_191, partial [Actinomycetota bacterium]
MRRARALLIGALSFALILPFAPPSNSAPNADLVRVRQEVEQLQEDAAEAGENAQAA